MQPTSYWEVRARRIVARATVRRPVGGRLPPHRLRETAAAATWAGGGGGQVGGFRALFGASIEGRRTMGGIGTARLAAMVLAAAVGCAANAQAAEAKREIFAATPERAGLDAVVLTNRN